MQNIIRSLKTLAETRPYALCEETLYEIDFLPDFDPKDKYSVAIEFTNIKGLDDAITIRTEDLTNASLQGAALHLKSDNLTIKFVSLASIAFPITIEIPWGDYEPDGFQTTYAYSETYYFVSREEALKARDLFESAFHNQTPDGDPYHVLDTHPDGVVYTGAFHDADLAPSYLREQAAAKMAF